MGWSIATCSPDPEGAHRPGAAAPGLAGASPVSDGSRRCSGPRAASGAAGNEAGRPGLLTNVMLRSISGPPHRRERGTALRPLPTTRRDPRARQASEGRNHTRPPQRRRPAVHGSHPALVPARNLPSGHSLKEFFAGPLGRIARGLRAGERAHPGRFEPSGQGGASGRVDASRRLQLGAFRASLDPARQDSKSWAALPPERLSTGTRWPARAQVACRSSSPPPTP